MYYTIHTCSAILPFFSCSFTQRRRLRSCRGSVLRWQQWARGGCPAQPRSPPHRGTDTHSKGAMLHVLGWRQPSPSQQWGYRSVCSTAWSPGAGTSQHKAIYSSSFHVLEWARRTGEATWALPTLHSLNTNTPDFAWLRVKTSPILLLAPGLSPQ